MGCPSTSSAANTPPNTSSAVRNDDTYCLCIVACNCCHSATSVILWRAMPSHPSDVPRSMTLMPLAALAMTSTITTPMHVMHTTTASTPMMMTTTPPATIATPPTTPAAAAPAMIPTRPQTTILMVRKMSGRCVSAPALWASACWTRRGQAAATWQGRESMTKAMGTVGMQSS